MYKNRYIIRGLKLVSLIGVMLLIALSCSNNDELNTDILASKQTTIKAFGPNPALRGQSLSVVGTHLDKISKVILPNNIEVTDIELISEKMIKVLIPQETEEGIIKLQDNKGVEYSFSTTLKISEPIEIAKISPQPIKAGQLLTLEGNYFNLIDKVILSNKVEIEKQDFVTYERTKIELILPAVAQTGVITLQNNDEIPLEYVSPEVLLVVLPSVDEVVDLSEKKPGDVISIKGKDLDLVVKVQMPNGSEVEYEIEDSKIVFTLPENISDGVVVMSPASGVEVPIANIGVALPHDLNASPLIELRANDLITIKGKNMELVTNISFEGVDGVVLPESKSNSELTVKFPEMAQSGEMLLHTASGKSVSIDVNTQKPAVTSMTPNPAFGGKDLTLSGTNLDLVSSISLLDNLEVEVGTLDKDQLTFTVPYNALSGVLLLHMNNKEMVEAIELTITPPEFGFIPIPPGPKAEIYAGGVLTVQVINGHRLTEVQVDGIAVNYIHDAPNLYIMIPTEAKGETDLKLISDNGEAVYKIPVIGTGIIETIIYEGDLFALNWGNPLRLNKPDFENVPAGAKLKIYMASTLAGASIAYSDANWTKFQINDPNFDTQWGTISVPEGSTSYEIELTSEIINGIMTINDGWSNTGLMLTGDGVIISKISIIVGTEPEETTIYEGNLQLDWGDNTLRIYKESLEDLRNGSKIKFYFTPSNSPSFAVQDANWSKIHFENDPNYNSEFASIDVPEGESTYELKLTQAILDAVRTVDDGWSKTAIIIGGSGMLISKVTVIK